jgi:hypothetical protein
LAERRLPKNPHPVLAKKVKVTANDNFQDIHTFSGTDTPLSLYIGSDGLTADPPHQGNLVMLVQLERWSGPKWEKPPLRDYTRDARMSTGRRPGCGMK